MELSDEMLVKTLFEASIIQDKITSIDGDKCEILLPDRSRRTFSREEMSHAIRLGLEDTYVYAEAYFELVSRFSSSIQKRDNKSEDLEEYTNYIKDSIEQEIDKKYRGKSLSDDERNELLYKEFVKRMNSHCVGLFYIMQRIQENFPQSEQEAPYLDEITKKTLKIMDDVCEYEPDFKEDVFANLFNNSAANKVLESIKRSFGQNKSLSDDEVILFINRYMSEDDLKSFLYKHGDIFIKRGAVEKFLTEGNDRQNNNSKAGMMTKDDFYRSIGAEVLKEVFLHTGAKHILKYLSGEIIKELYERKEINFQTYVKYVPKRDIVDMYLNGELDMALYHNNISITEILQLEISQDDMIRALTDRRGRALFHHDETAEIWRLFESEKISIDTVRVMERLKYFSSGALVNLYNKTKARKIAAELGEIDSLSNEKLLEYFTPDAVYGILKRNLNDNEKSFYSKDLKDIYESANENLEDNISDQIEEDDKENKSEMYFDLYEKEFFTAKALADHEISEEDAEAYCKSKNNEQAILIDFFNNGVISQDVIFGMYGDKFEAKALELIAAGMSPKIIEGLYSTAEIIRLINDSKLSLTSVLEIKNDINTGLNIDNSQAKKNVSNLLDLYLNGELDYAELYGLASSGIITIDEANEINEKYNILKDWEDLKKQGVEGHPLIGGTQQAPTQNQNPSGSKDAIGIDDGCIIDFYVALGATEYLEIDSKKCPVFKDYIIIPVFEKKVAYLEGKDARTYIVPIKIVLEQINNPRSTLDLIGNAPSRNDFNNNKKHIRSANHTRNWGKNVAMKTAELPSVPMTTDEAKEFLKKKKGIITSIQNSYDARKMGGQSPTVTP